MEGTRRCVSACVCSRATNSIGVFTCVHDVCTVTVAGRTTLSGQSCFVSDEAEASYIHRKRIRSALVPHIHRITYTARAHALKCIMHLFSLH